MGCCDRRGRPPAKADGLLGGCSVTVGAGSVIRSEGLSLGTPPIIWTGRPPAPPRHYRSIWTEAFPQRHEFDRCWSLDKIERVCITDTDTQVCGRPHVETTQIEEENHLGGPWADATDAGQHLDDGLVGHSPQGRQIHRTIEAVCGKVYHRRGLRP